jgi:hypothetical protein
VPDDEIMEFFRTHVKVKGSYEIVRLSIHACGLLASGLSYPVSRRHRFSVP